MGKETLTDYWADGVNRCALSFSPHKTQVQALMEAFSSDGGEDKPDELAGQVAIGDNTEATLQCLYSNDLSAQLNDVYWLHRGLHFEKWYLVILEKWPSWINSDTLL